MTETEKVRWLIILSLDGVRFFPWKDCANLLDTATVFTHILKVAWIIIQF